MKRLLCACLLVCMLGCDTEIIIDGIPMLPKPVRPQRVYPEYERETPTVNLGQILRQSNWIGSKREGSCVHATMVMLFRWQGREDLATKWLETYENAEWATKLAAKLDKEGVRYAYTWNERDVSFLEWACQTRRGCGVTVKGGAHMILLVHLDANRAGFIDNNAIGEIQWRSREAFLKEWRDSYSWAVTPVYTPPPPLPSKEPTQ